MKFEYSSGLLDAGLFVPVRVLALGAARSVAVRAKVDTGADISVLPEQVCRALSLKPAGVIRVRGAFDVQPWSEPTYFCRVVIDGLTEVRVEAPAATREHLLLGRDILNRLILHADGPARWFELT